MCNNNGENLKANKVDCFMFMLLKRIRLAIDYLNVCVCLLVVFEYFLFGLCAYTCIILPDVSAVNRFIHSNISIYEDDNNDTRKANIMNEPDQILILISTFS